MSDSDPRRSAARDPRDTPLRTDEAERAAEDPFAHDPRAPDAAPPEDEVPADEVPAKRAANAPVRAVLFLAGSLATLLAGIGAFLPILPTTPFLLLAGACFLRSSPRLHRRLQRNRIFGRYLVQWERDHTVPRDAKRKAYGLAVAAFALSIWLVDAAWLRWTLGGIGLALLAFLFWLPTTADRA